MKTPGWRERISTELEDLVRRLSALDLFLGTKDYQHLPFAQKELLHQQRGVMRDYASILTQRLALPD